MAKERFRYIVELDRDQVPGWNYEPQDFRDYLQHHLETTVPHYNPTVEIPKEE